MKIALFTNSLRAGGAERVVSRLASHWAQKGHEVTVITLESVEADFYPLHDDVRRVVIENIPRGGKLAAPLRLVRRAQSLRKTITALQPDIVISFMVTMNIIAVLACIGTKIPVIISERNNPRLQKIGMLPSLVRAMLYPLADRLVCVSKGIEQYFFWIPSAKKTVIYNPVVKPEEEGDLVSPLYDGAFILNVGRLEENKGQDMLIDAFARIAPDHPDLALVIVGEGSRRAALEAQIERLGLQGRVFLPGRDKNVFAIMKRCRLFVLSSRYEGFPNVLIEAMACGAPVVSYACQTGPDEIITSGENGILVEDGCVEDLALSIHTLLLSQSERDRLSLRARNVQSTFSGEKIMAEWEYLIQSVLNSSGRIDGQ